MSVVDGSGPDLLAASFSVYDLKWKSLPIKNSQNAPLLLALHSRNSLKFRRQFYHSVAYRGKAMSASAPRRSRLASCRLDRCAVYGSVVALVAWRETAVASRWL